MTASEAQALFLRELATIERIIAASCSRSRFAPPDIEDLAAGLRLKLIENDYAAIRAFEGKSAFTTYISVVIQRFIIDQRNQKWGRWSPSAQAVRSGEHAVALETLLHRDGRSFEEAFQIMRADERLRLERPAFEALHAQLPARMPRPSTCAIEDAPAAQEASTSDSPESRYFAHERERLGKTASDLLDAAISKLDPEDRLLLRMRFEDEMSVAQIARATGAEQRRLYYRIERLALSLRRCLEEAGVDRDSVRDLLLAGASALSLDSLGNPAPQGSNHDSRRSSLRGEAVE